MLSFPFAIGAAAALAALNPAPDAATFQSNVQAAPGAAENSVGEASQAEEETKEAAVQAASQTDAPAKSEKITDRDDPDFVRCRSEPVLGSRARSRRTCMTNKQWELAAREGNRSAMDMVNSGRPQQPLP